MILSMWKKIIFTDKRRLFNFSLKPKKVSSYQLNLIFKLMFTRFYPNLNFIGQTLDYNILVLVSLDFCINLIETHYIGIFTYLFLIISYFLILSYYLRIKYEKHYTFFDLIISAVLHCRLLFVIGSYLSLIIGLIQLIPAQAHQYIIDLFDLAFPQEYRTFFLDLLTSGEGKLISLIIILYIVITILRVKTNKKFWIQWVCFLICSFILRQMLLDVLQFLPSDISRIGVDILTAKLIFSNIFVAGTSEYFSEWKFSTSFREFIYWLKPVYHCDTTYGQWREYLNQQVSNEQTTSLLSLGKYQVGTILKDKHASWDLINMQLKHDDIQSLAFLNDRSYGQAMVLVRGGSLDNFYPIPYGFLLPDFFNMEPYNFVPFPFTDRFTIPAYEMGGAYPDMVSLVEAVNMKAVYTEEVVLASIEYQEEGTWENAHFSFRNRVDFEPAIVRDWTSQNMVYINMGNDEYIKYNPYYITNSMVNKPICIKMEEGVYKETFLIVRKLLKPNEVNCQNSMFNRYWKFSVDYLESQGKPYQLKEALRVTYALETSPILKRIDWDNVNWKQGNPSEFRR